MTDPIVSYLLDLLRNVKELSALVALGLLIAGFLPDHDADGLFGWWFGGIIVSTLLALFLPSEATMIATFFPYSDGL